MPQSLVLADRVGTNRQWGAYFLPYGEEMTSTGSDRDKFATYQRDSFTGLDYAVNRWYDSVHGVFVSPDPSAGSISRGNPSSWNRYAYAGNDPINYSDPSGLDPINVMMSVGGCSDFGLGDNYTGWIQWNLSQTFACTPNSDPYFINPNSVLDIGTTFSTDVTLRQVSQSTPVSLASNDPVSLSDGLPVIVPVSLPGNVPIAISGLVTSSVSAPLGGTGSTLQPAPYPARLFGTHWCGLGGDGPPVNSLDAACQAHDICYSQNNLTAGMNWGVGLTRVRKLATLQSCNQSLCNSAAATTDTGSTRVLSYFTIVPFGSCQVSGAPPQLPLMP
jgi:RHS repeat-associated protein